MAIGCTLALSGALSCLAWWGVWSSRFCRLWIPQITACPIHATFGGLIALLIFSIDTSLMVIGVSVIANWPTALMYQGWFCRWNHWFASWFYWIWPHLAGWFCRSGYRPPYPVCPINKCHGCQCQSTLPASGVLRRALICQLAWPCQRLPDICCKYGLFWGQIFANHAAEAESTSFKQSKTRPYQPP